MGGKIKDVWMKCPHCEELVKITNSFYIGTEAEIKECIKREKEEIARQDWDECLIKLRAGSPDWDD